MAKKLTINCASCDTRKVTEEKLAAYEEITINAAMVLTSAESRAMAVSQAEEYLAEQG